MKTVIIIGARMLGRSIQDIKRCWKTLGQYIGHASYFIIEFF